MRRTHIHTHQYGMGCHSLAWSGIDNHVVITGNDGTEYGEDDNNDDIGDDWYDDLYNSVE